MADKAPCECAHNKAALCGEHTTVRETKKKRTRRSKKDKKSTNGAPIELPHGYHASCYGCQESAVHVWDAPLPEPCPLVFWADCPTCKERTLHEWTEFTENQVKAQHARKKASAGRPVEKACELTVRK